MAFNSSKKLPPGQQKLRLGILVSGRGSNLQALIDASKQNKMAASIAVVISNKADALAVKKAQDAILPTRVLSAVKGESLEDYEKKLIELLKKHHVDLVVLAGFMRLVGKNLLEAYPNRIINIHPSLLPKFPGLKAQKQALEAKATVSGCTVHFVDEGCDSGPIIMQKKVEVLKNDSAETLSERILAEEHQLLPKVIDLIAKNKVKIKGNKVTILD